MSTDQTKSVATVAPSGSVAIIVTTYGPLADVPGGNVPVIIPVSGSIDKPSGNPVAVKVKGSPSISSNPPETSTGSIVAPSTFC